MHACKPFSSEKVPLAVRCGGAVAVMALRWTVGSVLPNLLRPTVLSPGASGTSSSFGTPHGGAEGPRHRQVPRVYAHLAADNSRCHETFVMGTQQR